MPVAFLNRVRGGASRAFDADVLAWEAVVIAAGGSVSLARRVVVDQFVFSEKASGAWMLTDDYWALWAENAPQALVSLKQKRTATPVNTPAFTADRHYTFDGATSYLNTGFIPGSHGINYTGTSQRIAAYERINLSASGAAAGTRIGTGSSISIIPRNGTAFSGSTNNSAGSVSFTLSVADSRGLKALSRAGGGTTALGYDRGVRLPDATGLTVGSSAPAVALSIGCINSNGTPISLRAASVGFVAIGGPLSDAQELAQYNAVQAWATSVGANV